MLAVEEDKHVVVTALTFTIALAWLIRFIMEITGVRQGLPNIDASMLAVLAYWFGTNLKGGKP